MNGMVFNIQRFSIEDGPGIRTTVFLKGCPLHCAWCHNPESHKLQSEIMFDNSKCMNCGACVTACPNHLIQNKTHIFDRTKCTSCGKCTEVCLSGALEICGKIMSDTEVMETVLRDKTFYQLNGGMTLSGGEPLMQHAFSLSLLELAKKSGIHTAIETSGFCSKETLKEISAYTDLFLFDIKHTDNEKHHQYTGVFLDEILENLAFLNQLKKSIILRCPMIPGVNLTKKHIENVFSLSEEFSSVQSIEFEPYHPLGVNKSRLLGKHSNYDSEQFLEKNEIQTLIDSLDFKNTKPYSIH